jgi:hypothetical protein
MAELVQIGQLIREKILNRKPMEKLQPVAIEGSVQEEVKLESWAADPKAFKTHFHIPYPDFCELIEALTPTQEGKYEKIRVVNTEAAILWAIHEGKSHGLLASADDEDEEE